MREEDWRDAYSLGLLTVGATAPNKRYKLSEILEVSDTYRASPGGDLGMGQFLYAMSTVRSSVCVGQCECGCTLIPWGICCILQENMNTACTSSACISCGFTTGSASSIFVALGAINGCGATLWRRIS